MDANKSEEAQERLTAKIRRLNERIVRRISTRDYMSSMEGAYVSYPVTLNSPHIKRLYLRFFERMSVSVNVATVLGDRYAETSVTSKIEAVIANRIDQGSRAIDTKIEEASALLRAQAITKVAKFLAPMTVEVRVTSPLMQDYLALLAKADHFLGMINTLWICGVVKTDEASFEEKAIRKIVGKPAAVSRTWESIVWKAYTRASAAGGTDAKPAEAPVDRELQAAVASLERNSKSNIEMPSGGGISQLVDTGKKKKTNGVASVATDQAA